MRHVKPHRWADAMQGRIDDRTRADMDAHADECARCAAARGRVLATVERTFPAIRKESTPDLAWDSIRAKVHWEVSSSRRKKLSPILRPRFAMFAFGLGLVGAAAGAYVLFGGGHHEAPPPVVENKLPDAPKPPAALVGQVSRVSGDVMIDGIRQADAFSHTLGPGALVATGDGRIDLQFGDGALSLGPRSRLELHRFDAQAVELDVDGVVDVEVTARAKDQRFIVHAGAQDIEVRGTQFRVRHDGSGTHVACRHGLVAVRDKDTTKQVDVGAGKRVDVKTTVASEHVVAMTPAELAELAAATPVTTLAKDAVPLDLTSAAYRPVRVDGVELGDAPMRVRVAPGRHLVEAADGGRYRRVQWVTVEPNTPASVRVELPVEAAPAPKADERRKQFLAGIDRARLSRCTRAMSKDDITGLSVQIEIGVDATGAVNFLNVVDSGDLDAQTTSCVRDVLADVRFGAGDAATWHVRIAL